MERPGRMDVRLFASEREFGEAGAAVAPSRDPFHSIVGSLRNVRWGAFSEHERVAVSDLIYGTAKLLIRGAN